MLVADEEFPWRGKQAPVPEPIGADDVVVPIRSDEPPTEWSEHHPPVGDEIDERPPEHLVLVDPARWSGQQPPQRRWTIDELIPHGQATLLTGAGSAGKSLVSQLMCTCIALGVPFLGIAAERRNALYVTCEDDIDELWRRQVAICEQLHVPLDALSGRLFLLSLQGEIGNELATFDPAGRMTIAPRYHQLAEAAELNEIGFVVLDNTGHFYSGNENDRHQVASFVGLCNRLAMLIGSVLFLGHPNKAGDSYSGSTAWENQVRSRLFMETPKGEDEEAYDPDSRVIRSEKSNYARKGSELRFMWFKGSFVLHDDVPGDVREAMADNALAATENIAFLECLDILTKQRRHVSHTVRASNYAPKQMARMPEAKGMSRASFERAMERLFSLNQIRSEVPLWVGKDRHPVIGIGRSGHVYDDLGQASSRISTHG